MPKLEEVTRERDRIYQLLPPLSEEEFEALKADIKERGVQVPVEFDEDGNILDGYHRVRVCQELGINDYPRIVRVGLSEEEKIEHVLKVNLVRRHLTRDQKKALALQLRQQGWSYRRIAAALGIGIETARRWTAAGFPNETPETAAPPETVIGRDGKEYPARKPKPAVLIASAKEQDRVAKVIRDVQDDLPSKVVHPSAVFKVGADKARKDRDSTVERVNTTISPVIFKASCFDWLPSQPQCDLLLTDPPYSTDVDDIEKFVRSWLPMALSKVKPTGRAYVFIGAYPKELKTYLNIEPPEHMTLANVLVWTYKNTLGPSPKYDYKLNWQAILYYRGADAPPLDCPLLVEQFTVHEVNAPDARTGIRYSTWEKPLELAERFIKHSTEPGQLVLDPFAGTGTFLLAAGRLGRQARGCDLSEQMVEIAIKRGCSYEA